MKRLRLFGTVGMAMVALAFVLTTLQSPAQEKTKAKVEQKGWLGVAIQDITSMMKKDLNLESRDGAFVSDVVKKSPADSAGLKDKDIILQFAGKKITDASDLTEAVAETKPGTKVDVVVQRKGEKKSLAVVIGKKKATASVLSVRPGAAGNFAFFAGPNTQGMSLRQLNEQLGQYFGVTEGAGVLVWEVEKGSAAEKAGLKAGDVITMVGKKKIKEMRDVNRALGIYDEGEKAEIEVMRKGNKQVLSVEIEEGDSEHGLQYLFDHSDGAARGIDMYLRGDRNIGIRVPKIHVEKIGPEIEHLEFDVQEMKENMKEKAEELRERIQKEVRPKVKVHISREI